MNYLKQAVGIDIAKDELVCKAGRFYSDQSIEVMEQASFPNQMDGFEQLHHWVREVLGETDSPIWFVMEATGVYYEELAYYLHSNAQLVSVLLPNKVKYFAKTLTIKSKTDALDAEIILRIGLERKLDPWNPPSPEMRTIRILTRELQEVKRKRTATKNQHHAKSHAHGVPSSTLQRLTQQIDFLNQQIKEIESELKKIVQQDEVLRQKVERLETIPGVGFPTIITLIGETNGFALFRNARQLVSYAGLDLVLRESGNWRGKTTISKKGNRFIRRAVFMPALSAVQHNQGLKAFYKRLCERKPAKKIGLTAVARKILVLVYTLWKNEEEFMLEKMLPQNA